MLDGNRQTARFLLPRRRPGLSLAVILAVVIADQMTKAIIRSSLALNESIPVLNGVFNITHVSNSGAAFGFLGSASPSFTRPLLIGVSLLAIGFLLYSFAQLRGNGAAVAVAIGLVLGGATGNLIDRVLFGGVTDFLDFYWGRNHWPAFNLADSSITVGVIMFLFLMRRSRAKP